jgi:excisionase family DNA binding protein
VIEDVLGHEMHVMTLELKPHSARPQGALPRLVGIDELAQQLGMSVRNIRRLVSERSIPHYKLGRLVRFDVDEVVAWLGASHVTGDAVR